MPIEVVKYKKDIYPALQAKGFASKFAIPFALEVCLGEGYDIGCNKLAWALPGAIPIDPVIDSRYHALCLPKVPVDYIYSSHCLEHIPEWVKALNYWTASIKKGGVLFLYLPHPTQRYWSSWVNTKHIHILHPEDITRYLIENGYTNVFCSERDMNHSYIVMGEKDE